MGGNPGAVWAVGELPGGVDLGEAAAAHPFRIRASRRGSWYYHADRLGVVVFQDMVQKYGAWRRRWGPEPHDQQQHEEKQR